MHELSVVTSLLDIIREEMAAHNATKLLLVKVRYGALASIVPDSMHFAFETLTAKTDDLKGAILELEKIPLTLRCSQCGTIFPCDEDKIWIAVCPKCATQEGHHIETGRELYLQHLEAE